MSYQRKWDLSQCFVVLVDLILCRNSTIFHDCPHVLTYIFEGLHPGGAEHFQGFNRATRCWAKLSENTCYSLKLQTTVTAVRPPHLSEKSKKKKEETSIPQDWSHKQAVEMQINPPHCDPTGRRSSFSDVSFSPTHKQSVLESLRVAASSLSQGWTSSLSGGGYHCIVSL